MDNSWTPWSLATRHSFRAHWVTKRRLGHLQIVETIGKEHEMITRQIVQLALRGSYNLIAVDEWLPDRDTLYREIRRYTLRVEETLDRPRIKRPMTCLQLLDLLMEADLQHQPTLILNFLYYFYNADVDLALRERVLEECCQYTRRLSLCNPVVVLVPKLASEEYKRFFPVLAAVADEILAVEETVEIKTSQGSFF